MSRLKLNNNTWVDSADKITDNFRYGEFASKDGATELILNLKAVAKLQNLREWLGVPIKITSAYRSSKHNSNVGSNESSRHRFGDAFDIQVDGFTPLEIAAYAEALGFTGIGVYPPDKKKGTKGFTHIDTRPDKPARWGSYQGMNKVILKERPKKEEEKELTEEQVREIVRKEILAQTKPGDKEGEHIYDKDFKELNDTGLVIHVKRFDDLMTRGEVISLLNRLRKLMEEDK